MQREWIPGDSLPSSVLTLGLLGALERVRTLSHLVLCGSTGRMPSLPLPGWGFRDGVINSGWAGFRDGEAAPIRGDRDVPCLGVGAGLY